MAKETKRYRVNVYTRINGELNRSSEAINNRGLTLSEAQKMLKEAKVKYPNSFFRLRRVRK